MDALLKSYMDQAEEAGLSEGDYLKVCNALKSSFEKVNTTTKQTSHDVKFTLEFKSMTGHLVYFNISKYIRLLSEEPNLIVYTFRVVKDGDIIREEVDKVCTMHNFPIKLKSLCYLYKFEDFTISSDVGSVMYNVKELIAIEHDMSCYINKLGPVYEDDDNYEPITFCSDTPIFTFIYHIYYEAVNVA